ncbi:hypothetical protein CYMTET_51865 [Cymbomonas tetramitiformis]|uniref:Ion transport domain-containing protein n=1 Tax=Cymbomonas tetramitiformis TaxID=36881 RepID=A0AAE0ES85_9CHLO|nr:hypothetical protein CYMTET_51865 [Cymbomonas tetramitiformis]
MPFFKTDGSSGGGGDAWNLPPLGSRPRSGSWPSRPRTNSWPRQGPLYNQCSDYDKVEAMKSLTEVATPSSVSRDYQILAETPDAESSVQDSASSRQGEQTSTTPPPLLTHRADQEVWKGLSWKHVQEHWTKRFVSERNTDDESVSSEEEELLFRTGLTKQEIVRAAVFMRDASHYRSPHKYKHDKQSLKLHQFRTSTTWRFVFGSALVVSLFASFLEQMFIPQLILDLLSLFVFIVDLILVCQSSGVERLKKQVYTVLFGVYVISALVDLLTRPYTETEWASLLKPIVIFYFSVEAQTCLRTTLRLMPSSLLIISLELYIVAMYACACIAIYSDFKAAPAFHTLHGAFMNLFELFTTVNNPDIWLPLYEVNRMSALVFISFLVICLFLVHNLVISTIFNEFTAHMSVPMARRRDARREALQLAFSTLDPEGIGMISQQRVMAALQYLRPHYNAQKIGVLYERVDLEYTGAVRLDAFARVADALNMRVHREKLASMTQRANHSKVVTAMRGVLAVANLFFILGTCGVERDGHYFYTHRFWIMAGMITAVHCADVCLRILTEGGFRGFFQTDFNTPALIASVSSSFGVITFVTWGLFHPGTAFTVDSDEYHDENHHAHTRFMAVVLMMLGRILDGIRPLRRIPYYRRMLISMFSVLPTVWGQFMVILTLFHMFAVVGMFCWKGRGHELKELGDNDSLIWLMNFDTYGQAMVTMFALMVVNNWHVIAEQYVKLDGMWAYSFFVILNLVLVTIALNIFTAYFISHFMVKFKDGATIPKSRSEPPSPSSARYPKWLEELAQESAVTTLA